MQTYPLHGTYNYPSTPPSAGTGSYMDYLNQRHNTLSTTPPVNSGILQCRAVDNINDVKLAHIDAFNLFIYFSQRERKFYTKRIANDGTQVLEVYSLDIDKVNSPESANLISRLETLEAELTKIKERKNHESVPTSRERGKNESESNERRASNDGSRPSIREGAGNDSGQES